MIVPAVIPCDTCELCRTGHDNACQHQIMPGNDTHGGFATDVVVPARHLVLLGADRGGYDLADLAVIADAVTTPYQALERAAVRSGDLVIVIGVGGIGTYARADREGARGVGGRHRHRSREAANGWRRSACDWRFNAREMDGGAIKKRLLRRRRRGTRWKIFEMSGTLAGQELAWSLLVPAGDARRHRLHDGQAADPALEPDGARRDGVRQLGLQSVAVRRRARAGVCPAR